MIRPWVANINPFVKFLQQLHDYSDNDLVSKLDYFLASRYVSLTTNSGHFVICMIHNFAKP